MRFNWPSHRKKKIAVAALLVLTVASFVTSIWVISIRNRIWLNTRYTCVMISHGCIWISGQPSSFACSTRERPGIWVEDNVQRGGLGLIDEYGNWRPLPEPWTYRLGLTRPNINLRMGFVQLPMWLISLVAAVASYAFFLIRRSMVNCHKSHDVVSGDEA